MSCPNLIASRFNSPNGVCRSICPFDLTGQRALCVGHRMALKCNASLGRMSMMLMRIEEFKLAPGSIAERKREISLEIKKKISPHKSIGRSSLCCDPPFEFAGTGPLWIANHNVCVRLSGQNEQHR